MFYLHFLCLADSFIHFCPSDSFWTNFALLVVQIETHFIYRVNKTKNTVLTFLSEVEEGRKWSAIREFTIWLPEFIKECMRARL